MHSHVCIIGQSSTHDNHYFLATIFHMINYLIGHFYTVLQLMLVEIYYILNLTMDPKQIINYFSSTSS